MATVPKCLHCEYHVENISAKHLHSNDRGVTLIIIHTCERLPDKNFKSA